MNCSHAFQVERAAVSGLRVILGSLRVIRPLCEGAGAARGHKVFLQVAQGMRVAPVGVSTPDGRHGLKGGSRGSRHAARRACSDALENV